MLAALAERAFLVVTDDFPAFFLPRMVQAAAAKVTLRLEQVDGNGLLPLCAADRDFSTAYAFRRFLQKELTGHLTDPPAASHPLTGPILALASTLAGNLFIVGSIAISWREHARVGIPVTILTLVIAAGWLWIRA